MDSYPEYRTEGKLVHLHMGRGALLADTIGAIMRTCQLAEDTADCTALVVHIGDSVPDLAGAGMTTQLLSQWERALRRLETVRVPTVCVIAGDCHGLMLDLMLCVDHRIASPGLALGLARAGDTLWPGMAIYRLAAQLGAAQARALILFGTQLAAEPALRLGLIDSIAADPESAGSAFVASLPGARIQDLSVRRHLLLESGGAAYEDMLGLNMAACDRTLRRQPAHGAADLPAPAAALRTHA